MKPLCDSMKLLLLLLVAQPPPASAPPPDKMQVCSQQAYIYL